jgi:DHA3 family tetracycline resistance protein-like MFS transporter
VHPIRSLSLYEFLASIALGLAATTGSLLQLQVGMSLADIAFVNIVFWVTIILAELPTGMLADGKSRIWSIRIGIVLFAISAFTYACVQGVRTALIAEITLGIGLAFISGAEQAWITDALKKRGEEKLIGKAFGSQAMASAAGVLIGGVLGAFLGTVNLRLGWITAGFFMCASAYVAWRVMDDSGEIDDKATELEAFRLSCRALRSQPGLLWSVAATIVFGLVVSFNHFWQPYFVEDVGQAGLGWVWAVIQASLVLAGWLVRRNGVPEGRGAEGILLALFLSGAGLLAVSLMTGMPAMLLCLSVHEFGRGLFRPIMSAYTQTRVESRFRATFGSLQSLLGKTGLALALVLVWFLSEGKEASRETIGFIWTVSGSLLVLGVLFLWNVRPKET